MLSLYDKDGTRRAALLVAEDGSPALALLDQNMEIRASLAIDADGPTLQFLCEKGYRQFQLRFKEHGPSLLLFSEEEKPRFFLSINSGEGAMILLIDKDGKQQRVITAQVNAGGMATNIDEEIASGRMNLQENTEEHP